MALLSSYYDEEFDRGDEDPERGPRGRDRRRGPLAPAPPVTTAPVDVLPDVTGPMRGGGGGGGAPAFPLSARPKINLNGAPNFVPPQFNRPTFDDAKNEPGYEFRLKGGSDALERSAAARGVLRTGGTLKDLVEYGQNFASQEYGNVFNRSLQEYDRTYRGAHDAFAPRLAEWQTRAQAELASALAAYNREFDVYALDHRGGGGGGDPMADFYRDLDLLGGAPGAPNGRQGGAF